MAVLSFLVAHEEDLGGAEEGVVEFDDFCDTLEVVAFV